MGRLISLSTMRPVVTPVCVIGQMVRYTGDMANCSGIGAVIALTGNEHGRYHVALSDGREFTHTNLHSSRWEIMEEIAVGDTLDVLRAGVAAKLATDAAAKTSAAEEFARMTAKVRADNPHLIACDANNHGGHVQAAKNIRIELKRAFPGVKFYVTSASYSGGNHVQINWTDGPMTKQVEGIADKYSGGTFDGMTDCYNYRSSPWTEVFGEAKYVSCTRHYSPAMVEAVIRRVCARLGGMDAIPTVEDYQKGRLFMFKQSGGCDVEREINAALSKHTYCLTR